MQAKNILNRMSSLFIVVEKDKKGKILYTNTSNKNFYDKENFAYLSIKNKYYRREVICAENSIIYIYIDVTEYTKDYLTGILNRFGFEIELHHMNYHKEPFIMALCDIDFFKKVNDIYGHPIGDYVLRELSVVISACIGDDGFVSRYGGEEFIIALRNFSIKKALDKLEELRSKVENCTFRDGKNCFHVTLTIGVAGYDPHSGNIAKSIDHADQAMYQGKIEGRNRVIPYNKKKASPFS